VATRQPRGGVSIANYTGGSMVTPANVIWCDGIDC
jgi:hypothetical protein